MIHVSPKPEPGSFHQTVRIPGERAVAEMVGKRPSHVRLKGRPFKQRSRKLLDANGKVVRDKNGKPQVALVTTEADLPPEEFRDYWSNALDDLMHAYDQVCAYSCFRIHSVTGSRSVDHMAPKSRSWEQVYEWSNYRLCSSLLNARKNNFEDVMDPFNVVDGWFELEMVGFQVRPAPHLCDATRRRVKKTIKRLGLNDYRFWKSRERDVHNYLKRSVPFDVLLEESPFVAKELARQGRLKVEGP